MEGILGHICQIIIDMYTCIKTHDVYFKYLTVLFVNYTSIKLRN